MPFLDPWPSFFLSVKRVGLRTILCLLEAFFWVPVVGPLPDGCAQRPSREGIGGLFALPSSTLASPRLLEGAEGERGGGRDPTFRRPAPSGRRGEARVGGGEGRTLLHPFWWRERGMSKASFLKGGFCLRKVGHPSPPFPPPPLSPVDHSHTAFRPPSRRPPVTSHPPRLPFCVSRPLRFWIPIRIWAEVESPFRWDAFHRCGLLPGIFASCPRPPPPGCPFCWDAWPHPMHCPPPCCCCVLWVVVVSEWGGGGWVFSLF